MRISYLDNPILVALMLLVISLVFRLCDIFVFRLDERWGEIIVSKTLGLVLILCFLWSIGQGVKSIGLHTTKVIPSLVIGITVTIFALLAGYFVEYVTALQKGLHPKFILSAIDPKVGISGGLIFGAWLFLGNIVNAFMEEGLFRGVMIRLFRLRFSPDKANWFQSILFGAWHLPWVFKGSLLGNLKGTAQLTFGAISNFVPQVFTGFVWGYMYLMTNSLWTPWVSHLLTNSTINFLHIQTDEGLNSGMSIRMVTFVVVMLLSVTLIKHLANKFGTPELRPWG